MRKFLCGLNLGYALHAFLDGQKKEATAAMVAGVLFGVIDIMEKKS